MGVQAVKWCPKRTQDSVVFTHYFIWTDLCSVFCSLRSICALVWSGGANASGEEGGVEREGE